MMPKLVAALLTITALAIGGCGSTEGSGPPVSADRTEEQATTPVTTTPTNSHISASTRACAKEGPGAGVEVGRDTSCVFAIAVLKAYTKPPSWEPNAPKSTTVSAWSPMTRKSYSMACAPASGEMIDCTGSNGALVVGFRIAEGSRIASEAVEANREALERQHDPNEKLCIASGQTPEECQTNREHAEGVSRGVEEG
jgi:hypothetical protein